MPAVPRVIVTLTCLSVLCFAQESHRTDPEPAPGFLFAPSTPAALKNFWLDFHSTRLCQDIDAVFVFHERGLEAWCLADNSRSLDRLRRMTGSLVPAYRVDLYITRPQPERDRQEDKGPPPGLWNNQELRAYLGNVEQVLGGTAGRTLSGFDDALFTLTHRVQMFADQTLEFSRRMEGCATDLEGLSVVAFDPAYATADRTKARALCALHTSDIDEFASKLDQNLRRALPPPAKRTKRENAVVVLRSGASPRDMAAEIALEARKVAHRVYRFIYPDEFTVGIEDLREPGLLESLAVLRKMTANFQHRLKKS
jgi:hypothetical protein